MASKPSNRHEGPSQTVRPDSPFTAEVSWMSSSTGDDPILREVEDYAVEVEIDSINALVEGDDSGEGSLVGRRCVDLLPHSWMPCWPA
ncbi:hypothetical protein L484_019924 [Morus notabilis]|uniref:Uncharacterized protein n=1 Tax=Morus notabilis TaxID=981085 RepID=W9RH56_9ROSA|nr:hypothetical protein L484_019924 [Morus notabilis]